MKTIEFVWCCLWAYLDIFGEWLERQVDHNDYLAGAIGALVMIELAWAIGIIDIVLR